MTKRAALARALALDPRDRVSRRADVRARPDLGGGVRRLDPDAAANLGLTVFMVTHDLDSLNTVCDRIAVLADGKVVAEGPMPAMLASRASVGEVLFPRQTFPRAQRPRQTDGSTMETRAPYALIGLFVLATIGAVFGFVYWLHNTGGLGERTVYRVRFENTVSGLLPAPRVLFNGIRVGEVTDLAARSRRSAPGHGDDRGGGDDAGAGRYAGRIGVPGPDRRPGDLAARRCRRGGAARRLRRANRRPSSPIQRPAKA